MERILSSSIYLRAEMSDKHQVDGLSLKKEGGESVV